MVPAKVADFLAHTEVDFPVHIKVDFLAHIEVDFLAHTEGVAAATVDLIVPHTLLAETF